MYFFSCLHPLWHFIPSLLEATRGGCQNTKQQQELTCMLCVSVSPPPRRLQHPGRQEPGPAQAAQEALQGRLLSRAGLRAGAPLQPPAVPVRPGAGRPGGLPQAHRDPSQDLVPEPPLQDEAPPDGRRFDGVHPGGQEGGGEGFGAGRPETVRAGRDPAAPAALPAAVLLLPIRLLPPCMDTVCVCGEPVTVFIRFFSFLFLLPGSRITFHLGWKTPEGTAQRL